MCSLPGDYGSNPAGLGSDPDMLLRIVQAKLMYSTSIFIPACLKKSLVLSKNDLPNSCTVLAFSSLHA
ncbi:hypothetical protein OPV22_010926 [Ensete ventricosum]|uniref:Uncharacterized protein n=1 Tax=Ensete ventricosum TaxID=4639 RepID=A0AAV8RE58_ENSVE|nr:hypothetical protein OPV22_010926 [Ensete ventricosum]